LKRKILLPTVFTVLTLLSGTNYMQSSMPVFLEKQQAICLTENIYHEARGEPFEGQLAVAKVTLNRAKDLTKICQAVYAPYQFSWDKRKKVTDAYAYYKAHIAAHEAFNLTFKATHYHAVSVRPRWAKKLTFIKQIGNHKFYYDY
jgi:N-acetylmuramoyl-L-alanine amidase